MRPPFTMVIGLVVLLLTGCASHAGAADPPDRVAPRADSGTPVDVVELVGTWSVTGTGVEPAVLVLQPAGFELRTGSDSRFGAWRAAPDGTFLAQVSGASGPGDGSTPEWLGRASSVATQGADRVLGDAAGAVTARLTPTGPRPPLPDADRQALRPPAPLPAALAPADPARLAGRWEPAAGTRAPQRPHVVFEPTGAWAGSDGCNGAAGRWTGGSAGLLLGTSGPQTLIGCEDMVGVPGWVALAARAGFDGPTLVLLDAAGQELGRLDRA